MWGSSLAMGDLHPLLEQCNIQDGKDILSPYGVVSRKLVDDLTWVKMNWLTCHKKRWMTWNLGKPGEGQRMPSTWLPLSFGSLKLCFIKGHLFWFLLLFLWFYVLIVCWSSSSLFMANGNTIILIVFLILCQ